MNGDQAKCRDACNDFSTPSIASTLLICLHIEHWICTVMYIDTRRHARTIHIHNHLSTHTGTCAHTLVTQHTHIYTPHTHTHTYNWYTHPPGYGSINKYVWNTFEAQVQDPQMREVNATCDPQGGACLQLWHS